MKRGSKGNVILYGLWTVLAAFKVFLQILRLKYNPSVIWLILSIILFVFFTILFIVEVKRYRSNKDEQ
jgi:phosphatidylglycerophosphatase A